MSDYVNVKVAPSQLQFNTGAVRGNSGGKGRYDLLPAYAVSRLAKHFENGAKVYADENWRKGIPLRRYLDSALRHTFMYLEGRRDEDHAAAAMWNMMALIETEEMIRRGILPAELNNLPDWTQNGEVLAREEPAKFGTFSEVSDVGYPTALTSDTTLDAEWLNQWLEQREQRLPIIASTEKSWQRAPDLPVSQLPSHSSGPCDCELWQTCPKCSTTMPEHDLAGPAIADLDKCGTLNGKTPLPDLHFNDPNTTAVHWIYRNEQVRFGLTFDTGRESRAFKNFEQLERAMNEGHLFEANADGSLKDAQGIRLAEFDIAKTINLAEGGQ